MEMIVYQNIDDEYGTKPKPLGAIAPPEFPASLRNSINMYSPASSQPLGQFDTKYTPGWKEPKEEDTIQVALDPLPQEMKYILQGCASNSHN